MKDVKNLKPRSMPRCMIILLCALVVMAIVESKTARALTASELQCGAKMTYLESRSLSPAHWDKVFKVSVNRSKKQRRHLCDVIKDRKQFTSAKKLHLEIKEPAKFAEIHAHLARGLWMNAGRYTHFHSKNGRMYYASR